jgi:hypothetical protein
MAEERTKPLTLAKTSLTKTKSVAVVLSVCALLFIGVLGLGSLYMTGKTSPYGGNTVGTALPSGSKGYQVPYGSVHLDASTFALDGSAVVADGTRLDNQNDCTTVTIEKDGSYGTYSFAVEPGYTCPTIVNKYNWLGGPQADGNTYAVTQTGDSVSVVRSDTGNTEPTYDGYTGNLEPHYDDQLPNLQFECCAPGGGRLDITQLVKNQQGFASHPVDILATAEFSVTFDMYIGAAGYDTTGMALGADGLCMNLGGGPGLGALGGGAGEDGVAKGVAVCFDEYANSHHEHGFFIYYNGAEIYADASECDGGGAGQGEFWTIGNDVECPPVSLVVTPGASNEEIWHTVKVTIGAQEATGGAQVYVDIDTHSDRVYIANPTAAVAGPDRGYNVYTADIAAYDGLAYYYPYSTVREQVYLSFSARTGGHVNYHSVRNIRVTKLFEPQNCGSQAQAHHFGEEGKDCPGPAPQWVSDPDFRWM